MLNEKELLLRGFVTPEDTDGCLQKAIDTAIALDIRKVVVAKDYTASAPILLSAGIHLVIDGATLYASIAAQAPASCSFSCDRVYIEGRGAAKMKGDVLLYNTQNAVIENLDVDGSATLAFARKTRVENVSLSGAFTVGRGTVVLIAQHVRAATASVESIDRGEDVIGLEPTVRSVALRNSAFQNGIALRSAEDFGLLNVQVDHVKGDVTIGEKGASIPAENYFNLTVTDIDGEVIRFTEAKNLTL